MGFRDAQGKITDKSKALIEAGKFTHRNGSIYETYRIARTEVMRMNAFAKYDQFEELRKRYPNARLKLIATLDDRTRPQSREMNGQISNAKGEFLYPDAKYYRLGTAPAQWCINDRETCTIVFLDNKEVKENREELRAEKEEFKEIDEKYEQFSTGEQANNFFYNNSDYKKWAKSLTNDERSFIKEYTGELFSDVNDYLRGFYETDSPIVINGVKNIEKAINKFELSENITVYRGINKNAIDNFIKENKITNFSDSIGKIYNDKAFMSTSAIDKIEDYNYKDIQFVINVPKGKGRGAYINNFSFKKDEEYEFLLQRNSNLLITNVKSIENSNQIIFYANLMI